MPPPAMATPQAPSVGDPLYDELWHACAGPLVTAPRVRDLVFYFPQGHIEQVEASMNQVAGNQMRLYDLPPKLLCRVINIELKAEADIDKVYAQVILMLELEEHLCGRAGDSARSLMPATRGLGHAPRASIRPRRRSRSWPRGSMTFVLDGN